jgi:thiol-disulfide isomerase/thioredoxin
LVLCAAVVLAGALALSHLGGAEGNPSAQLGQFIVTEPPRPVPDAAFLDGAGTAQTLADFKGRVVLVNLWATWCAPCVQEMPALDRLEAALGGPDFAVLLVSQDRGGAHVVEPFFAKLGLKRLATYLDPPGALGQGFAVRGMPTSILIDRDGKELGRVEGAAAWDQPRMLNLLKTYAGKS